MDPPVSEPVVAIAEDAAIAAAEPPLDPPGIRLRSHGLRVGGVDTPSANSWVRVFPSTIAPLAFKRFTTVQSSFGT